MGLFDSQTPDQQNALNQGLLGAGLGILASNHGQNAGWASIGQGGLQGLSAYNSALAQSSKARVQDATTEHLKAEAERIRAAGLAAVRQQRDMETAWQQAQAGMPPPPPGMPPPGPGQQQPQSDLTPQAPQAPEPQGMSSAAQLSTGKLDFVSPQRAQAKAYANMADQLRILGQFEKADKYTEMSQKLTPTIVSEKVVTDPKTGERVYSTLFSDNSHAAPPYKPEPGDVHWMDTGTAMVGIDKATRQIVGTIPKQQSLESRAANAVAMRGQDMTDARARDALVGPDAPITPDAIKNAAARYNMDGTLPPMGMGKAAAAGRSEILNAAAEMAKAGGQSPDDQRLKQMANKANVAALTKLQQTQTMVASFEENFKKNADMALEMSDKVNRTGVPLLNEWINKGKRNIGGDADLAAYDLSIKAVVNEYAKIISGSMGNTAVAEGEIKKMDALLSSAQTPSQVKSVIALMKRETANRIKGMDEEKTRLRSSMTGSSGDKPEDPLGIR